MGIFIKLYNTPTWGGGGGGGGGWQCYEWSMKCAYENLLRKKNTALPMQKYKIQLVDKSKWMAEGSSTCTRTIEGIESDYPFQG